jgi:hypothetical protein
MLEAAKHHNNVRKQNTMLPTSTSSLQANRTTTGICQTTADLVSILSNLVKKAQIGELSALQDDTARSPQQQLLALAVQAQSILCQHAHDNCRSNHRLMQSFAVQSMRIIL